VASVRGAAAPPPEAPTAAAPQPQEDSIIRQAPLLPPISEPENDGVDLGDDPFIAAWEDVAVSRGKRIMASLPQLEGFTLNRVGTPRVANTRTLHVPIQATHTDTLNREDLLLEVRLGDDGRKPLSDTPFQYGAKGAPTVSRALFLFVALLLLLSSCGIGFLLLGGLDFLVAQGLLPG
jgi:hypothetical protein